eukprot:GHVT01010604.1.p2 GENE.GHVT01010604.1~~GHVT01010604.1.p2  ORF type:complete len:111 (+),score=1.18 GHVT01010604.1:2322-2654(+)
MNMALSHLGSPPDSSSPQSTLVDRRCRLSISVVANYIGRRSTRLATNSTREANIRHHVLNIRSPQLTTSQAFRNRPRSSELRWRQSFSPDDCQAKLANNIHALICRGDVH